MSGNGCYNENKSIEEIYVVFRALIRRKGLPFVFPQKILSYTAQFVVPYSKFGLFQSSNSNPVMEILEQNVQASNNFETKHLSIAYQLPQFYAKRRLLVIIWKSSDSNL